MSGREEGFTILEALVAFAILASVLVALYGACGISLRLIGEGSRVREAALLMQSKLDELKATTGPLPPLEKGTFPAGDFSWRVETHDLPGRRADAGGMHLQSVLLTVSWPSGNGTRSQSVETRHLGTASP